MNRNGIVVLFALAMAIGASFAVMLDGCSASNAQMAGKVIKLGAEDCVELAQLHQDLPNASTNWQKAESVCATIEDLVPLVPVIAATKQSRVQDAGADATGE